MVYSYNSYTRSGLIIPLVTSIIAICFEAASIIVLVKKKDYSFGSILKGVLIPTIICVYFLINTLPTLRYTIFLLIEKPEDYVVADGIVESVSDTITSPRYYVSDESTKIVRASIIRIGSEKYYFMSKGSLKVGSSIEFKYLPHSRVVLSWDYSNKP